jgi:hypothetical protein
MTKYKVLWPNFEDHEQGDEFEADLDEDLESRAVARGQLEIVSGKRQKKEGGEQQ